MGFLKPSLTAVNDIPQTRHNSGVPDSLCLPVTVPYMRRMWHVWPGQWWPMLPTQEAEFISELETLAGDRIATRVERDDVTALLNALRCGTSVEQLLVAAPGVHPGRLVASYRFLERHRAASEQAWLAIEADPTPATLHEMAALAGRLLPVPMHRILSARDHALAERVTEAIAEATSQVHRQRVLAKGLEAVLEQHKETTEAGIEIGARLYNPMNPGVYGDAYFLPDRVASLSPVRVADLLGEQRSEHSLPRP